MEKRLENRLQTVYNKMKRKSDRTLIDNDIKNILEEFKQTNKEEHMSPTHKPLQYTNETNNKTHKELLATKKRLNELEESKMDLVTQVKCLKDQLGKLETNQQHHHQQQQQQQSSQIKTKQDDDRTDYYHKLEREIEYLKLELTKSKQNEKKSENYENNNNNNNNKSDYLSDHNHALKVLLKEKEIQYIHLNDEIRTLKEKDILLEKTNQKLQIDLDLALAKLTEMNQETDKYSSYLRACEEQINLSEKKRDDLKQDAQETIKLWKNKVKKLEKNIEKLKLDCDKLEEQNQFYKSNQNNIHGQFENKSREFSALKEVGSNLEEKSQNLESEVSIIASGMNRAALAA
jgi:hypothetical protein